VDALAAQAELPRGCFEGVDFTGFNEREKVLSSR
jgi:hypothetical protein